MSTFKIKSQAGSDLEFSTVVPAHIIYDKLSGAEITFVHGNWGYCIFQLLKGFGVEVWDSQYYFLRDTKLYGSADIAVYELHSAVENHFDYSWDGVDQVTEHPGQGSFTHNPFVNNVAWFKGGMHYRTTDVHFKPWLLKPFSNAYGKLYTVMDGSINKQPGSIHPPFEHNANIKEILSQIRHSACPVELRERFIKSKCEELLIAAMNQVHPDFGRDPFALSADMEEKIKYIELTLRKEMGDPPSLSKMANLVHSNMQYIQQAFRTKHGMSIFKYLHKMRVETVKEMLLDPSVTLVDIALATGLYDAARTSNAFYVRYGVRPKEFRKTGRTKRD